MFSERFDADFNLGLHKNFLGSADWQPVAVIYRHGYCIFYSVDAFVSFIFDFSLSSQYFFIGRPFCFKEFDSLNSSLLLNLAY